ncbi:putative circularly permuted ATP-grasp superfamily protein [Fontibacillus solani]|uniref:Putative circularly permuted ATP-grasp superfamily protein n=1 Tax=Fontibacillus solani TaxID=1572857 RepID=A0A7W3XTI7_9BACL|nr:circularly permuted type 2 ATP-grasp protein [Fontibacillus solani]MBA9087650.1 putative circularly permuted ATP-grasp superfamily protein [Fontibacillus solani]
MQPSDSSKSWNSYQSHLFYDEMFEKNGTVRPHYSKVFRQFQKSPYQQLADRQQAFDRMIMEEGITFTVYGESSTDSLERTIPFDLLPRIIPKKEWLVIERGMIQRVKALNLFLYDIYHGQEIVKEGIIPRRLVMTNKYFRYEMMHLDIPNNVYITASGIDLIRNDQGQYLVLEDNLRSPSGFSYLFKNRSLMSRLYPELMFSHPVQEVEQSLEAFLKMLRSLAPGGASKPVIALMTPGCMNSAYYEHTFLAQQMGIELVEGSDLVCRDQYIYIRTLNGYKKVDVLYRRIDDEYLDPLAFRPDSLLGCPGLMNAYRAGHIAIANAPGTGVADDKAMYSYVPQMIRYYLNEEPILSNVPTYLLDRPEEREYVLDRLDEMVVKETSMSGGYGMLIGPAATEEERSLFSEKILQSPGSYIAQPTIKLSTSPVLQNGRLEPRHIDLRGFVLNGDNVHVIPGGLTRVAMQEGSLVVNSSQGGGCKDTWVLTK